MLPCSNLNYALAHPFTLRPGRPGSARVMAALDALEELLEPLIKEPPRRPNIKDVLSQLGDYSAIAARLATKKVSAFGFSGTFGFMRRRPHRALQGSQA